MGFRSPAGSGVLLPLACRLNESLGVGHLDDHGVPEFCGFRSLVAGGVLSRSRAFWSLIFGNMVRIAHHFEFSRVDIAGLCLCSAGNLGMGAPLQRHGSIRFFHLSSSV